MLLIVSAYTRVRRGMCVYMYVYACACTCAHVYVCLCARAGDISTNQTHPWTVFLSLSVPDTDMARVLCLSGSNTDMARVLCQSGSNTDVARVFSCFWDVIFSGHSYSYLLGVGQKCSSIVRLVDWLWMLLFSQQAFFSTQRVKPCWQVSSLHDHKQAKVIVMKMEEDFCDEYVKFVCLSAQKGSTINNKECLSTKPPV